MAGQSLTMRLDQALARFQLSDPQPLDRTRTSALWTVTRPDGSPAVLKLLHPGQIEEARAAAWLQALGGHGAVQVYALDGQSILMEHCPGPSLGDLSRAGRDDEATGILCDVIRTLHAAPLKPIGLEPLAQRFAPLTEATLTGDLAKAAQVARDLLADPIPAAALHGDLHHDNILQSPRGWLAIDPKGVQGDAAYEPANAFRNPDGLGERLFDPARLQRMAAQVSRRLGPSSRRLLGWAAAHCALSTRWSLQDRCDIAPDMRLLPLLLAAARR